jgi:hypothetical protein
MTEREFAVASLVQHAMRRNMPTIKLVLKLDRAAESVGPAAAREYDDWLPIPKWTEERQRQFREFEQAAHEFLRQESGADEE